MSIYSASPRRATSALCTRRSATRFCRPEPNAAGRPIAVDNQRARKLVERLGFRLEGIAREAWTKLHRRRTAGLKFAQAAHHIVLEDYIAAIEAAETRHDRLTAQIEARLSDWTLAPVVAALQTMPGIARWSMRQP